MSQPQKGVCAEPNLHSQYLMFSVTEDDASVMRSQLVRVLSIFDYYEQEYFEAMVTGMIAIGASYWHELYPDEIPQELDAFPDMQCDDRIAPDTQSDLFIQIRTDRIDVCYAIAQEITNLLRLHVELIESVNGFRYLDGRDLNGFVYGSENPVGRFRRDIAFVNDDNSVFLYGSYIHVQRFRHDLRRWDSLSERQKEQVMGVTREHNLTSPENSASSHAVRASTCKEGTSHGHLLLQGMPYGDMKIQGLYFVSCACSPLIFKERLYSQIVGTSEGDYDRWLDYTQAETGGAYFAPSITFINQNAKV